MGLVVSLGSGIAVGEGSGALTEVSLSYVDVALKDSGRAVSGRVLAVVAVVGNVDLSVGVTLIRLTITSER